MAMLSSEYFQEIHATSSFENIRFVTSVPGHVKSSQNTFSESTIVVWVLFWFCAHLPHIEFNLSLAKVRCPAFFEMDALSRAIPSARR